MRHIYTLVSKLTNLTTCSYLAVTPLINLPSYLGVEAFDPYISTQVNGIHTIARCMDDEIENPQVSTYLAT